MAQPMVNPQESSDNQEEVIPKPTKPIRMPLDPKEEPSDQSKLLDEDVRTNPERSGVEEGKYPYPEVFKKMLRDFRNAK